MDITIQKIKDIFKKESDARVDVEKMDPDKSISDQGIDSLDRSSIFLSIEDEFGITITDLNMEKLDTLNKIVDFIQADKK